MEIRPVLMKQLCHADCSWTWAERRQVGFPPYFANMEISCFQWSFRFIRRYRLKTLRITKCSNYLCYKWLLIENMEIILEALHNQVTNGRFQLNYIINPLFFFPGPWNGEFNFIPFSPFGIILVAKYDTMALPLHVVSALPVKQLSHNTGT